LNRLLLLGLHPDRIDPTIAYEVVVAIIERSRGVPRHDTRAAAYPEPAGRLLLDRDRERCAGQGERAVDRPVS
jgi:hypothetical protein